MQKLNWREKYAAILILVIGIVVLIVQVFAYISSKSNVFSVKDGVLVFNKDRGELFSDIRSFLTIILAILGGILLLRSKLTGWVIGFCLHLLFVLILSLIVIGFAKTKVYDGSFITAAAADLLFLLAAVFLLIPSTLKKYRVGTRTLLPTLLFFITITAVYFFLQ